MDPVYNVLVFFIDTIRGGDVGLAIIATVIVVKVILYPLSLKAVKTQKLQRELEPVMKEIKEKHKDNREELARATMAAYKDAGMNPFASILVLLVQLPFLIALYLAVSSGGGVQLPGINTNLLYSFIPQPGVVSMDFIGLFNIAEKSVVLALLAGVTQFIATWLSMPALPPKVPDAKEGFKEDFARNMQLQMKYVMPMMITFIAYTFSSAIALYFIISNIVTITQEFFIRKHR
jgi:YidC/Oxa1 family membrane protein insertase